MNLERQYREAIIAFEPRIMPDSLQVRMVHSDRTEVGRVGFEIKGHLWALPHPERIYFRTDIDLETGVCEISAGA
jgi:type VI secretion system protein ImpF